MNTDDFKPTPLDAAKPWWASRTIVSLLILVLVNVLGRFGVIVDHAAIDRATDLTLALITSALALVGIWGRAVATKQIGSDSK